jgi:hypothetical protein
MIKPLAAVSPKHSYAAQNFNVTSKTPIKKEEIRQSDSPELEKEDAVDLDSWLTPKHSAEKAPPFG